MFTEFFLNGILKLAEPFVYKGGTMTDPVITDEARHDRDCQRNRKAFKLAIEIARAEYEIGALDDWISDECDPTDTFKLAHALVQWLDDVQSEKYDHLSWNEIVSKLVSTIDPFAFKDFEATIQHVIEQKAELIMDES